MAELIAKVGAGGGYRDGATLHAMTERRILLANAQRHLGKRDQKTNNVERANQEGFISVDDPLFDHYELTHEFKFEHFGQGLASITRLSDGETIPIEDGKTFVGFNGKPQRMAVRQYITRRRRSHRTRGRIGVHMFGSPAREIWFGGSKDFSELKVNQTWDVIESKLQIPRDENKKWPMGNTDIRHAIGVPVATLTEDHASFIEQGGNIRLDDDRTVQLERRTSRIDYKNLPGLDPSVARAMSDRQVPIDIRDYYLWDVNEILLEYNMNSAILIEKLADEIRLDPLGRGYAGMSDDEIAVSLRAKDRTFKSPITSTELLAWGSADGRLARIKRVAEMANAGGDAAVDALQSAGIGAWLMVHRDAPSLDLNLQDRNELLDGLVAGGVLAAADKTALEALATTTGSRAEELFGEGAEVYSGHIQFAKKINAGQ